MGRSEFVPCPECGALVKRGRLACRECGSDAQTGWKDGDEIEYQSIEIPDGWGPAEEELLDPAAARSRKVRQHVVTGVLVLTIVGLLAWALRVVLVPVPASSRQLTGLRKTFAPLSIPNVFVDDAAETRR